MRDSRHLRNLAARISLGRPVDWSDEERAASSDAEREAIRELRVIAAMAAFGEAIQSAGDSADLSASVSLARSVLDRDGADRADADTVPPLTVGQRWGQVEIVERVGRGAFGDVYRARDTRLDRVVALKLLRGSAPSAGDEVIREARLLARVRHPNVVTVYGADRIDGRVGIWMEYLDGETLDRVLRQRGTLDAREAALIGIDLCRALAAVHAAGVAHRDVKLANVMRAKGGRIVLMDFGLGHEGDSTRGAPLRQLSGTPLFMAPEVLRGSPGDPQSDIYSLGVVLFALVTGRLPVEASTLPQLVARHERRETRRVRDLRSDVPEAFVQVLDRVLDHDRATRFRTAGEAEDALVQTLGATVAKRLPARASSLGRRLFLGAMMIALVAGGAAIASWMTTRKGPLAAAPRPPFRTVPDRTIEGEHPAAMFGLAIRCIGDVDKDGYDDVVVAAPLPGQPGPAGGRVYLYRGNRSGLEQRASWSVVDPDSGRYLGQSIAPRTDFNLDGFVDLVIGAPGMEHTRSGRVLVFPGSRNGYAATPAQTLRGPSADGLFGFAISTGDVNHDGREDLLVGAPLHPPARSGRAFLYLSVGNAFEAEPSWTFTGPESSAFGIAVTLEGDVNRDGYQDAVIGAPLASSGSGAPAAGAAFVFLGSLEGLSKTPMVITGRQREAMLGRDVVLADLDGDGFDDVILGAEEGSNGEQGEGIAEVHFSSHAGVSPYASELLESNVMGANFGGHAASLGDVNGDGCDDLFVGALRYQQSEPRAGAAFVFGGSRSRVLQRPWIRVAPRGSSWLGAAAAAGDVNGDGRRDLIVGAPSWDAGAGANTGMVEVFLGPRAR